MATCLPDWRRFNAALRDPERAQAAVLAEICRHSSDTAVMTGRFEELAPRTWEDFLPLVQRAAQGQPNVLTRQAITRFEPTSGSSAANKLVPSTPLLRRQFNRAIHAWAYDLLSRQPALLAGPAYWSISPVFQQQRTPGGIPVGFEEDSAYLGRYGKFLMDRVLAVPAEVRHLSVDNFRRATLLLLLAEPELRLISVWNPSFLTSLMREFERDRDALLAELRDGVTVCGRRLQREVLSNPWPRLGLISCWTDGQAQGQLATLKRWFPETPIQPKGLIATEAFVSLPFRGQRPLAITSHYFEFEQDDGRLLRVADLREGDEGTVIVTTGGGLLRYRLGDRVAVTGFLERTPCIRFLGRQDLVSDICGEKLTDAFVASIIRDLDVRGFCLLAPDGAGYTLFARSPPPAHDLEQRLQENVHYRWAVQMGQLRPAQTLQVNGDAEAAYLSACEKQGRRPGDVKPVSLDPRSDWRQVFERP
ncbi:MAG: GH3 auxin-responsive promoter family protein [Chromatiales bacterium]|nr:MAG: GH3 auxin-responsive promoter family protein [Chromatiales bacterium]